MELILRDLEIESLKEHLNNCLEYRESLARDFEAAPTSAQQTYLAFTWDAALKHGYMVEFLLALLERHEREGSPLAGTQHIRPKAHRHRASASSRHVTSPPFAQRISSNSTGS
jgi:hypothetical protein